MGNRNAATVDEKVVPFFINLKCAGKVSLGFGSILRNLENWGFRCFYAHKNNNPMSRSKLVVTKDDLAKFKDILKETELIEFCYREIVKWNLPLIAVLFNDVPMDCMDAVLPDHLLKVQTIICLTFQENTRQPYNNNLCLLRALVPHLHGSQRLEEENSKICTFSINRMDGLGPNQFKGVRMNNNPVVEDSPTRYSDIRHIYCRRKAARRSVQKYEFTLRLMRYNNQKWYVIHINAVFQPFCFLNCDNSSTKTLNFVRHFTTCSERVKKSIPGLYLIFEKLSRTSWTLLVLNTPVNKSSPKPYQYWTMIRSVSKRRPWKAKIQQPGYENMSRYLYPFHQTLLKNQFFCNSDPLYIVVQGFLKLLEI